MVYSCSLAWTRRIPKKDLPITIHGFSQLYKLVNVFTNSVLGFQGNFLDESIPIVIHDGIKFHQELSTRPLILTWL